MIKDTRVVLNLWRKQAEQLCKILDVPRGVARGISGKDHKLAELLKDRIENTMAKQDAKGSKVKKEKAEKKKQVKETNSKKPQGTIAFKEDEQ